MDIVGALLKHGSSVAIGFILGLLAIAVIAPMTRNGQVLLMVTVMAIVIVGHAMFRMIFAAMRARRAEAGSQKDVPKQ